MRDNRAYAFVVLCVGGDSLGQVQFKIPINKIRNNDKICRYCPVRRKCQKNNGKTIKFYEIVQKNPNIKLPIHVFNQR